MDNLAQCRLGLGLSGSSSGKESTCSVGDLGSILGWEDPLEKGLATHSSILAWRIHEQSSLAGYSPWDHKELDVTERLTLFTVFLQWMSIV